MSTTREDVRGLPRLTVDGNVDVGGLRQSAIGQRPTAIIGEVVKTLAKLGRNSLGGTIPARLSVSWSRLFAE